MADEAYQHDDVPEESTAGRGDCPTCEECPPGVPAWVVTFGDMMSLLLCFFVLIISFSTMDVIKYRSLVGSLRSALGAQSAVSQKVIAGRQTAVSLGEFQPGRQSMTEEELENDLVAAVEEEGMTGEATLHRTDRGIVLRVRQSVMFEPGSARILPESMQLLKKVALVCRYFPRTVYVEGHTDNIPVQSELYPSNWELSAARACAAVRFLLDMEHLPPEKFVASGLAATVPIASGHSEEARAKNRRVEFVFSGRPGGEYDEEP
jgi:chemotaxis protein MotB